MTELENRARARERTLRAVIKRSDSADYAVVSRGSVNRFTPAENIGRLEYLRSMAFPELLSGLRMDRSVFIKRSEV